MFVLKRDGRKEPVHFDKITARITKLSYGLNTDFCDPVSLPCYSLSLRMRSRGCYDNDIVSQPEMFCTPYA